jgi:hypothetical protein
MHCEWLTASNGILLEMLTAFRFVKKPLNFNGARSFITVFTTARHWSITLSQIYSVHTHTSYSFKFLFSVDRLWWKFFFKYVIFVVSVVNKLLKNTDGMILQGDSEGLQRKSCFGATWSKNTPHMDWLGIQPGPPRKEAGDWLPAWGTARLLSCFVHLLETENVGTA